MQTTPKTATSPATRDFYTPEESCNSGFFDALADVFTHPEDLPLHQPDYGMDARRRDREHIREYFDKAIAHAGFSPEEREAKKTRSHTTYVISRKGGGDVPTKLVISRLLLPSNKNNK